MADTSGLRSPLTYQVNNTTFTDIDVSGTIKNCNQIGSLVGYLAFDSTFTNCKSSATLVIEPSDKSGKYRFAGGLVSQVSSMIRVWKPIDLSSKYAAEFTNCEFSGTVTAIFKSTDQSLTDRWLYVGGLIAGTTYNGGNTYFAVKFADCTVTNENYLTIEKKPNTLTQYSYYSDGKVIAKTDSSKSNNAKAMKETVLLGRIHENVYVTYNKGSTKKTSYGYNGPSGQTVYGQMTWDGELVPGIDFWYGADTNTDSATKKVVTWAGDATNGYTLEIHESGTYKLMTVSADNVVIDGSYNKATSTGNTITAVGTGKTVITINGITELKNCNIVANSIRQDAYATSGFIQATKQLTLTNSVINLGQTMNPTSSSIVLNLDNAEGSVIKENTIITGKSTGSSSQGILVKNVDQVTIENNTINLNEAKNDATSSGSVGVRLYGDSGSSSVSIVIKGNSFNTMGATTARESGISVDTTAGYTGTVANPVTIAEISGNIFNLANTVGTTGYGTAIYLNPKAGSGGNSATIALTSVSKNKISKGTHGHLCRQS